MVIGFDTSLLVDFYAAKRAQGSGFAAAPAPRKDTTGTLPPWDVRNKQPSEQKRLSEALGDHAFIDLDAAMLRSLKGQGTNAADNSRLYALYKAVNRLATLATFAAGDDAVQGQRAGLDRRFQAGVEDILSFLETETFDSMTVIPGVKKDRVTTSVAVPLTTLRYVGGPVIKGDIAQVVPGLAGTETITLSVTRAGSVTDIAVDLSQIGGPLTLDAVASAFNTVLEQNGMATRFHRVEIGSAKPGDPKTFGLSIDGVSAEKLTMRASDAEPALYVAGVAGARDAEQGRLVKLAGLSGDVESVFSRIIGADTPDSGSAAARASVIDALGNVYVVGDFEGDLGSETAQGSRDVFLRKYDSAGTLLWTRSLGASGAASGLALALDPAGGVVVAGKVTSALSPGAVGGGTDGFVAKYAADGKETFLRQIAPRGDDEIRAVAVGADGAIYLGGTVNGAIVSGQASAGAADAFITKLDASGALLYHRQFGTAGKDAVSGLAVSADGTLIAASTENGEAVVRKFNTDNGTDAALWTVTLGDLQGGALGGLVVANGSVYVAGTTANAALDAGGTATIMNAAAGGSDAFVFRVDDLGGSAASGWVSYAGTDVADRAGGLTVLNGDVYLAGETVGVLAGEFQGVAGARNMLVAKFDGTGALDWARQYGGAVGQSSGYAITADAEGAGALDALGLPRGVVLGQSRDLISQSTVRPGDYFTLKVTSATGTTREKRIVIGADETLTSLASKLNRLLLLDGKAEATYSTDGQKLRISVKEGVKAELLHGKPPFDALEGLGFDAHVLVHSDDDAPRAEGEALIAGLGLEKGLGLRDKTAAAHASEQLQSVLAAIRSAYRKLNEDPNLARAAGEPPKGKTGGTVPAYLTRQIASYQNALARLTGQ